MEETRKTEETMFDFEKLTVYCKAMEVLKLLAGFTAKPPRRASDLADHLDRALDSVLLNIAEGSGKPSGSADRARYYRTALGSAKEVAAAVSILAAKGLLPDSAGQPARGLLLEVVAMLHSMAGS